VLSAPLPTDTQGSNFPAGQQTQYAALQAYQAHGHDLLILSGASPMTTGLAIWPTSQPRGWDGLVGQVYVLAEGQDTPEPFQTPSTDPDKRGPQLIVGSALTLALLLMLLVWLRRRPGRG
ncbi:MAG: hypothetical protein MUE31_02165, partial [Candidatus Nanopelagicales bacterium]|nr:hypothetical protein [Candidatus Nanopelagicales bacterium]